MSCTYNELQKSHPCFGNHKNNVGRIHLPVSPGCNIACRFCDRALNDVEQRPGGASKIITPEESVNILQKALAICPDITVAGIAGPGDTLASDYALETFQKIKKAFPRLLKCMSTNGLLLYERAEEIIEAGIDSLTVTVNAVDPYIEAQLNKYIIYHGKKYESVLGARILIDNQLKGIEKVSNAGITVTLGSLPGVVAISHAAEGCAGNLTGAISACSGNNGEGYCGGMQTPTSAVREKNVIFGGTERLRKELETAEKILDAKLFVVVTGCMTEIIGDDIQGVIDEFEDASTPVIAVNRLMVEASFCFMKM